MTTINSHLSDPSIFPAPTLGYPQRRKKIGGKFFEDQVTTDPSFVFAPPDKLKEQLGILGSKFLGCDFEITVTVVWLFPPKAPVPGYSLKILQHIKSYMFHELQSLFEIHPPQNRGMHSQHAIPLNDEATTFKALCLSLGREDGRCFPGKNRYQEIGEDAWLASKFKCYWCSSCDLHCSKWQKGT